MGTSGMKSTALRSSGTGTSAVTSRSPSPTTIRQPPRRAAALLSGWPSIRAASASRMSSERATPTQLVSRDKPSDHSRGAAAETSAERYVVAARDPDVGHRLPSLRKCALDALDTQGSPCLVPGSPRPHRQTSRPGPAQVDPDLVPDIEGQPQAVEARPHVGAGSGHSYGYTIHHRTAKYSIWVPAARAARKSRLLELRRRQAGEVVHLGRGAGTRAERAARGGVGGA